MNIIIAGDFFISNKYDVSVDEKVKKIFNNADFSIINLEAPISNLDKNYKIIKTGPNIQSDPQNAINFLKGLNVSAVTLANNHILDYGQAGLNSTLKYLKSNNIKHIGLSNDVYEIQEPLVFKKNKKKVAILNFCENEWSTILNFQQIASPLNIISITKSLLKAKSLYDKVVCIIHGGLEYSEYPDQRMINLYRYFVDMGADAVISHHTHIISKYEVFKGAPIFYGIGNFLFTLKSPKQAWYRGLIIELDLNDGKETEFNVYSINQTENYKRIYLSEKRQNEAVKLFGEGLKNKDVLLEKRNEFLSAIEQRYFQLIDPIYVNLPIFFKRIFYKIGLKSISGNKKFYMLLLNLLRCESHREALIEILQKKVYEKSKNRNSF